MKIDFALPPPPPPHDTTLAFITNETTLIIEVSGCCNEIKE